MGTCKYCGQDAGFLSKAHKACKEKHERGIAELQEVMENYFWGAMSVNDVQSKITETKIENFLQQVDVEECASKAIDSFTRSIALPITKQHIVLVDEFQRNVAVRRDALNINGELDRLAMRLQQGILLGQLAGSIDKQKAEKRIAIVGKVLPRPTVAQNNSPVVLLSADESVIWEYQGVAMHQEKTEKEWVGRNSGFSFRVTKNIRYHTGSTRGHAIEHSTMKQEGIGNLILTNKNIIFNSTEKAVKIPYKKILSFTPYANGVEIQRDTTNSPRLVFLNFDGWFLTNLLAIVR